MSKYEFIYNEVKLLLGSVESTFQPNKFPLLYLRISDDDTDELTELEANYSGHYKRKVVADVYYQKKYDNNLSNEQVILNDINHTSDQIEVKLHSTPLNAIFEYKQNNDIKYTINLQGLKIINNNRAVNGNIGLLWLQIEINYTQIFH